jgi:hypothetical protein
MRCRHQLAAIRTEDENISNGLNGLSLQNASLQKYISSSSDLITSEMRSFTIERRLHAQDLLACQRQQQLQLQSIVHEQGTE